EADDDAGDVLARVPAHGDQLVAAIGAQRLGQIELHEAPIVHVRVGHHGGVSAGRAGQRADHLVGVDDPETAGLLDADVVVAGGADGAAGGDGFEDLQAITTAHREGQDARDDVAAADDAGLDDDLLQTKAARGAFETARSQDE